MASKPNKEKKRNIADVANSSLDESLHVVVTKEELQEMIKKGIATALKEERERNEFRYHQLSENVNSILEDLNTLKSNLKTLTDNGPLDVSAIKEDLTTLDHSFQRQLNELENYQRRENVRIFGLPESKEEKPIQLVTQFLAKHNFNIKEEDIHIAHRVGRKVPDKSRAMIVRFFNRNTRNKVIKNRKVLRGKGVSIGEDVSQLTMKTLIRVQQSEMVAKAWVWGGKVFATLSSEPDGKPFVVKPFELVLEARGNMQGKPPASQS